MADEHVERQLEGLLASYGSHAVILAQYGERLAAAAEDRDDLRELIIEVRGECRTFRDEYREDRKAALERSDKAKASNRLLVGAIIAGSCTVLAAIIAAVAAIVTGGG